MGRGFESLYSYHVKPSKKAEFLRESGLFHFVRVATNKKHRRRYAGHHYRFLKKQKTKPRIVCALLRTVRPVLAETARCRKLCVP